MPKCHYNKSFVFAFVYLFLALTTCSTSFSHRPLDVRAATALQTDIWNEYVDANAKNVETPGYSVVKANITRVFFPFLTAALQNVFGLTPEKAFSLLRLLSVFAFYVIFHAFLRVWLDDKCAFAGTLFVAATIPLTFNLIHEFPTEFPEMIFFTLGVWAIYLKKFWTLVLIVLIATLNRETSVFLPLIYLVNAFNFDTLILKKGLRRFFLFVASIAAVGFAWLIPYFVLRFVSGLNLQWNHQDSLAHNLPGLTAFFQNYNLFNNYLFYLYLFGAFWLLPVAGWNALSIFWKRTLLAAPVILAIFVFGGGFLDEPREIVPLYPILVPAALITVFGSKSGANNVNGEVQAFD